MKNIHVIPIDKPSFGKYLVINKKGKLCIWSTDTMGSQITLNPQNIYITNSEEIKEGDWCINLNSPYEHKELCRIDNQIELERYAKKLGNDCKKIILTTDQALIKDGVQAIDDEFLNWFVNNPTCEEVKVENSSVVKEHIFDGSNDGEVIWEYKIIIPSEEPKQEQCDCKRAYKETLSGIYGLCWDEEYPTKQKTLEEARKYAELSYYGDEVEAFIKGAKWQAERMYSEEDMIEFSKWRIIYEDENPNNVKHSKKLLNEWFEQFKKG